MAYPGLSLGTSFFMRQNSTDIWEFESIGLGYGVKLSKKIIFTFREFLKHAEKFLKLITSSQAICRKRQSQ